MKKIIIPTKVCIDFTCPDHEGGLRVASGGEMVSGDIISWLFTQAGREQEDG